MNIYLYRVNKKYTSEGNAESSFIGKASFAILKQWDGFEYLVELTVCGVFFFQPLLQHLEGTVLLGKPLLLYVRYLVPTQG